MYEGKVIFIEPNDTNVARRQVIESLGLSADMIVEVSKDGVTHRVVKNRFGTCGLIGNKTPPSTQRKFARDFITGMIIGFSALIGLLFVAIVSSKYPH